MIGGWLGLLRLVVLIAIAAGRQISWPVNFISTVVLTIFTKDVMHNSSTDAPYGGFSLRAFPYKTHARVFAIAMMMVAVTMMILFAHGLVSLKSSPCSRKQPNSVPLEEKQASLNIPLRLLIEQMLLATNALPFDGVMETRPTCFSRRLWCDNSDTFDVFETNV